MALSFHGVDLPVPVFKDTETYKTGEHMITFMFTFLGLLFAFGVLWHDQPAREP